VSAPHPPGSLILANAALLGAAFSWGSFYGVAEELLRTWDPYSLSIVRLVLASVILSVVLRLSEGPRAFSSRLPWRHLFLLGGVGIGTFALLLSLGIQYSGAISSALVFTSSPIVAAFLARILIGHRLRWFVIAGAALAVAGGAIVSLRDGQIELKGGEVLLLVAIFLFNWYSLKIPDWLRGFSKLSMTTLTIVTGAIVATVIYGIGVTIGLIEPRASFTPRSVALVLYMAVTSLCLAILFWNYGVARLGVPVSAMYANLSSVFAVLVSIAFGVAPDANQIIGGILIFCGVLAAQGGSLLARRRAVV
jgi:drug/metabolite transporter (DMT)-like permease